MDSSEDKTRLLLSLLKVNMKKIVLAGPTGAGKTSIFKLIFPYDEKNLTEVVRNVDRENAVESSFTPIDQSQFRDSTTTVSFNITSIVACIDTANRMNLYQLKGDLSFLVENDFDLILPLQIVDLAGQDRFSFMVETMVKGASSAILVADGTNVGSINRLPDYNEYIRDEELRTGKKIERIAFVNKADMKKKSLYLGAEPAKSALPPDIPIYETTIYDKDSLLFPIRQLIVKTFDKPLSSESLKSYLNSMHSIKS
ncbi:MAG: hypothetical protein D6732_00885 [Methanobacteriota archaeon]|nr:MAG: hypothetical protein D6732_00885 [Euryarchaeota archaeon]